MEDFTVAEFQLPGIVIEHVLAEGEQLVIQERCAATTAVYTTGTDTRCYFWNIPRVLSQLLT